MSLRDLPMGIQILAVVGITVIAVLIIGAGYAIFSGLKFLAGELRWRHKYNHRFDKPPTAKCYCKDCKWHINDGVHKNKCTNITWADRYTPNNGFCYDAEPKARDDDGRTDG